MIESNGPHPVTVLLGNPRAGSRTANVARRAADTLVECLPRAAYAWPSRPWWTCRG
ncbi:hypothetical protein V2I01_41555 [Micromonospora sp. BRA006-A]|nr:hypothetical protein [Micromonospora sp. BRA006-A]